MKNKNVFLAGLIFLFLTACSVVSVEITLQQNQRQL